MALERLGDSRADAAYARATALAPEDPLVRLNLAGRHARAGRLVEAVEEADATAKLLQIMEKPDPQVVPSVVQDKSYNGPRDRFLHTLRKFACKD